MNTDKIKTTLREAEKSRKRIKENPGQSITIQAKAFDKFLGGVAYSCQQALRKVKE